MNKRDGSTLCEPRRKTDGRALHATIHRDHQIRITGRNFAMLFGDNGFGSDAAQFNAPVLAAVQPHLYFC